MKNLLILSIAVAVYVGISLTAAAPYINFPITMLCTFLHEFGHAFFAVLTGGSVISLQVNPDGSGVTWTSGGSRALTLMGGYIGSAVFGNILLRVSLTNFARWGCYALALASAVSAVMWFSSLYTMFLLAVFSGVFLFMAQSKFAPYVLQFIGVASLIYIIQDFNVGPTGDLQMFASEISPFPPAAVMMYVWLGIVLALTVWNGHRILTAENKNSTAF